MGTRIQVETKKLLREQRKPVRLPTTNHIKAFYGESDKTVRGKHDGYLNLIRKNDMTPHRDDQSNEINASSTVDPNFPLSRGKLDDENQYDNSSTLSMSCNSDSPIIATPYGDKSTSRTYKSGKLGIYKTCFAYPIDETPCGEHKKVSVKPVLAAR